MYQLNHALFGLFGKKDSKDAVVDSSAKNTSAALSKSNLPPLEEPTSETIDLGKQVIEELISKMGFDLTVSFAGIKDSRPRYELGGEEDIGRIIGREGFTIKSLQTLATTLVNRKSKQRTSLSIDANDYQNRRQKNLEKIAINAARMAVTQNREVPLEPMSASDRRLVHMLLQDHAEVETFSQGEGRDRHLVIAPKK
jgi:spoIIIJ-associated protein